MKHLLTFILLIIFVLNSYCQRQHSVTVELIPVAKLFTEASGAQVSYNLEQIVKRAKGNGNECFEKNMLLLMKKSIIFKNEI